MKQKRILPVALGSEPAELVLKNVETLNVFTGEFLTGDIAIAGGRVAGVGRYHGKAEIDCAGKTAVPGFIDSHIHMESSMLSPTQFARAAAPHGTTAIVTDPHEIANVCGENGIQYMLRATRGLPLDVFFMVPSCVPCSKFDENGCTLGTETIRRFLTEERVLGLAEMMNYPGVLYEDPATLEKIDCALAEGGMVDGHAPGLTDKQLNAYVGAGVTSDHEATCYEEALEKLRLGQWIMIREGTAARNLDALYPLLQGDSFRRCLFCCDDVHPGELLEDGHIDRIVRRAIARGANPAHAFIAASFNAAQRFGLGDTGAIAPGYFADLVLLSDRENVTVEAVYKRGSLVAMDGELVRPAEEPKAAGRKAVSGTVRVGDFSAEKLDAHGKALPVIGLVAHRADHDRRGQGRSGRYGAGYRQAGGDRAPPRDGPYRALLFEGLRAEIRRSGDDRRA